MFGSSSGSQPQAAALPQTPDALAPPPMFGQQAGPKKPKPQGNAGTFLGTGSEPGGGNLAQPSARGQATVLGA